MISADEFYRRRDNRATRLVGAAPFDEPRTAIVASDEVASSTTGQIILLVAANLMSRWSRVIDLDIPDVPLAAALQTAPFSSLRDRIHKEVRAADPFGDFGFRQAHTDALTLRVAPPGDHFATSHFSVWADDWDALGWSECSASEHSPSESCFAPAAAVAACLGVAAVFKIAMRQEPLQQFEAYRWSLWDYTRRSLHSPTAAAPPVPPASARHFGRLLQVGVGAVGSCIVYLLDLFGCQATMLLVDYDHVELENLGASMLFGVEDAISMDSKVMVAERHLCCSRHLAVDVVDGSWNDLVQLRPDLHETFDLWIPVANQHGVRRSMANSCPPLMIHGSTSSDWDVFSARHIPFREHCLSCRFPEVDPVTPAFPCGAGAIQVTDAEGSSRSIDASLPFLSAAAAALVIAELFKLEFTGYPALPNYVQVNLAGTLEEVVARQLPRNPACSSCGRSALRSTWANLNGRSRYAELVDSPRDS